MTKVYDICTSTCVRADASNLDELRDVEKFCGRNCLRKYDKVYKLYDKLEGKVLTKYCEDENIDADRFMQMAQEEASLGQEKDMEKGLQMINENKM